MRFYFVEQRTLHLLLVSQSTVDTFLDSCAFKHDNEVVHFLAGSVDPAVRLLKGFVGRNARVPDYCTGGCKR